MTQATETAKAAKVVKRVWKCQASGCSYTTPPTVQGYDKQAGHQLKHSKRVPKKERGICLIDESTKEVLAKNVTEARDRGLLEPEEKPSEVKPEKPPPLPPSVSTTEKPTEPVAEPTVKVTEPVVEKPTESVAEPTVKVTEPVVKKPTEPVAEKPVSLSPEPPSVSITEKPSEQIAEKPEEKPEEKGAEKAKELSGPLITDEGIFNYNIALPADAFSMFLMAKATGLEPDKSKTFDVWIWDCVRKRFETDYKMQIVLAGIPEE